MINMHFKLRPGDVLVRRKLDNPLINHYGIFLGYNAKGDMEVIENSDVFGVRIINYFDFTRSCQNLRIDNSGAKLSPEQIVKTAKSYLNYPYSLVNFNCEHFANLAKRGKAHSSQVNNAVLLLGISAALFLSSRS